MEFTRKEPLVVNNKVVAFLINATEADGEYLAHVDTKHDIPEAEQQRPIDYMPSDVDTLCETVATNLDWANVLLAQIVQVKAEPQPGKII